MLTLRSRSLLIRGWKLRTLTTGSHPNSSTPNQETDTDTHTTPTPTPTPTSLQEASKEPAADLLARQLSKKHQYNEDIKKARRQSIAELRGPLQTKTLNEIISNNDKNYNRRYSKPSKEFAGKLRRDIAELGHHRSVIADKSPASKLFKNLGEPKTSITIGHMFKPLAVGDAVEMSTELNRSVLAVIAEVPSSHDDPRYTVMDRLGELSYVEKSSFKLRIPRVIPRLWLKRAIHNIKEEDAEYGSIKSTSEGFDLYAVNPFARSVIAEPLVGLTNSAWALLPQTSRKLEVIHRLLQTVGPRQVSLITLARAVTVIDLVEFEEQIKSHHGLTIAYQKLGEELTKAVGPEFSPSASLLGKEFGMIDLEQEYNIGSLYAVVLALRKQPRLWGSTNSSRSALLPMSITVLPMDYASKVEQIVQELKKRPQHIDEFQKLFELGDFSKINDAAESILFLLKEYAVGNVSDPVCETMVCQIMKTINDHTVTKTTVWEFLLKVGYIPGELTNPTHYALSLALPRMNVSSKADTEQMFFDLVDVAKDRGDDLASNREDYTHMNVYCIDSATAHEIDDGVSIEDVNEKTTRLHIHIADPVSYMDPNSDLTKVAFERAFTTYQPEMISAMLPKSMSQLAGLGVDGTKTRALTFSVSVDKSTGEADFSGATVAATYLSRFPKYTYNDVDAVLNDLSQKQGITHNIEHAELWEMKQISEQLRSSRVRCGAVIFPEESLSVQVRVVPKNSIGGVSEVDSKLDDGSGISIDGGRDTASVVLVSEFMILANRIAAHLLNEANKPGVFKAMPRLQLWGTADKVVSRLSELYKQGKSFGVSEIVKALKFITPAVYRSYPSHHLMLGVGAYAPSTSPLRRFGDIVNHFQLHAHLNKLPEVFSKEQVQAMVLHIEARNDILKKTSRSAGSYYTLKYLKEQLDNGGSLDDTNFIVMSKPMNGSVNGLLLGYGAFGQMTLASGRKPPLIGETVGAFKVAEVDYVGGRVVLEQL